MAIDISYVAAVLKHFPTLYFSTPGTPRLNSYYGPSNRPYWLNDLQCDNDEQRIDECSHNGWGANGTLWDNLGVVCTGKANYK